MFECSPNRLWRLGTSALRNTCFAASRKHIRSLANGACKIMRYTTLDYCSTRTPMVLRSAYRVYLGHRTFWVACFGNFCSWADCEDGYHKSRQDANHGLHCSPQCRQCLVQRRSSQLGLNGRMLQYTRRTSAQSFIADANSARILNFPVCACAITLDPRARYRRSRIFFCLARSKTLRLLKPSYLLVLKYVCSSGMHAMMS